MWRGLQGHLAPHSGLNPSPGGGGRGGARLVGGPSGVTCSPALCAAGEAAARLGPSPSHRPFQFLSVGALSPAAAAPPLRDPGLGAVTPGSMEPFLRKRLTFLSFFWDKIWPVAAPDDGVPGFPDPAASAEPEPPATEPCGAPAPAQLFRALYDFTAWCSAELSVSRGDRLYALKAEGDYIFARRLSGPPSTGLVPITHLAKATPETLADYP